MDLLIVGIFVKRKRTFKKLWTFFYLNQNLAMLKVKILAVEVQMCLKVDMEIT